MSKQKCFFSSNAHLDPVWLWPWEEGLIEAISTFRVAADFIDANPEFVFNHNESLLYEWVERNDPKLFERIKQHVASGRWHPAGGAYLQPDLIATSGESVIRQFLVGKRYFAEKFCAMAWWLGRHDYPAKDLEVAWKDILFAEFHDSLPGSGIPKVEEDSLKLLGHCEEILRRKKAEALIALLRDEPLAERDAPPFFIFNPFNWEVAGNDTEFTFTLEGKCYRSEIGAHCLQTLRIRRDGTCEKTNLLESEEVSCH